MSAPGKARIIVTLTVEYDGDDVQDYNQAMDEARALVDSAGVDLEALYENVRHVGTEVTG